MASGSDIGRILERQARFWEVRERLVEEGGEAARRVLAHLREGPWISISRQWGSGGVEIANRVAAALHWQAFDREILSAIAEYDPGREVVLARLDEHAIGQFDDYVSQMLVRSDPGQRGYLQRLARVVWGLARKGNAVIIGRGANWFLDARFGLRVRVVAPLELRQERLAVELSLSGVAARERAAHHDAEQTAFIRQVFGRSIDDPLGYDLTINTASLTLEAAVETVVAALRGKLEAAAPHGAAVGASTPRP